ncbi:hypothetical protein SISSUDRAFT_1034074 [Sistotremastrum suecicum HHB10207 ss-3]|uniref:Uncharacterized protein n=1 Tax=Sistotremastrum suecicum HHB10207 ss-3 TaxID=1314776 RepID=A0A166CJQ8_9AGAM|nr:hypothetical protein SISSUDRAFT_1034074 [Sistotremastrum suecicum HHB10207 ss-3]
MLSQLEINLLTLEWTDPSSESESEQSIQIVKDVVSTKFLDVLSRSGDFPSPFSSSSPSPELSRDEELRRLCLAISALYAFIQQNWTGPSLDISSEYSGDEFIGQLACGGEPAYHLVQSPGLLLLAQRYTSGSFNHLQGVDWWRLRIATIHQLILDSPVLLPTHLDSPLDSLSSLLIKADQLDLTGRLMLERGMILHYLQSNKKAADYFVEGARVVGLEYELTGALGRRTKFQQVDHSQLVLLAQSRDRSSSPSKLSPIKMSMPETLALNDDTLLEHTIYTSSSPSPNNTNGGTLSSSKLSHINPSSQPPLHPLDQSILLSLCLNVRNSSPSHGLTSEQMSPYISRILSHPQNWSIHTTALLLRSRLESTRTRTVERSTLQLQALVEQIPADDASVADAGERLRWFWGVEMPSKWALEKELAERYMSLGVVKSALEIYEKLEMWESVVGCWQSLERPQKAIQIVRSLLDGSLESAEQIQASGKELNGKEKKIMDPVREAKLWCILGDLEPPSARTHYEHAWTLSGHRSARAARSLGFWYFNAAQSAPPSLPRTSSSSSSSSSPASSPSSPESAESAESAEDLYKKAISYFTSSLTLSPLSPRTLFILGVSQVRLQDWNGARESFSRVVGIDEDDSEGWSNLGSVYVRMAGGVGGEASAEREDESEPEAEPEVDEEELKEGENAEEQEDKVDDGDEDEQKDRSSDPRPGGDELDELHVPSSVTPAVAEHATHATPAHVSGSRAPVPSRGSDATSVLGTDLGALESVSDGVEGVGLSTSTTSTSNSILPVPPSEYIVNRNEKTPPALPSSSSPPTQKSSPPKSTSVTSPSKTVKPSSAPPKTKTKTKPAARNLTTAQRAQKKQYKLLAFRALQQGLKHAYSNWRMWTNYLYIALDPDVFAPLEASRAFSRIVEERLNSSSNAGEGLREGGGVDWEVLERLVEIEESPKIVGDWEDEDKLGGMTMTKEIHQSLQKSLSTLFTSTLLPNFSTSLLYTLHARHLLALTPKRWGEAFDAHLQAYRASPAGRITAAEGIPDEEAWREAVASVDEFVQAAEEIGPHIEETEGAEGGDGGKWRKSVKSVVKTFLGRTRKEWSEEREFGRLEDVLAEL